MGVADDTFKRNSKCEWVKELGPLMEVIVMKLGPVASDRRERNGTRASMLTKNVTGPVGPVTSSIH